MRYFDRRAAIISPMAFATGPASSSPGGPPERARASRQAAKRDWGRAPDPARQDAVERAARAGGDRPAARGRRHLAGPRELVSGSVAQGLPGDEISRLGFVLVRAAGLSVPVLLMLTAFYKPWGPIVYQQRAQLKRLKLSQASSVNAITDPARAASGSKPTSRFSAYSSLRLSYT